MAYKPYDQLTVMVDSIGGGALRIHHLAAEDDLETVTSPGYLHDAEKWGIREADFVIITTADSKTELATVAEITASGAATLDLDPSYLNTLGTFLAAPRLPQHIKTMTMVGHTMPGDVGRPFRISRMGSAPLQPKAWHYPRPDGSWWYLDECEDIEPEFFGGFGAPPAVSDGSLPDATAGIQAAIDFVAGIGKGKVKFRGMWSYKITSPLVIHQREGFVSDPDNVANKPGIHWNRIPQIRLSSDGDARIVAGAAMTRMLYYTDNSSGQYPPYSTLIEGISFDGANLANRCIENFYAFNLRIVRCKFIRAVFGYYNNGAGIASIHYNKFFTRFGVYNIKGGDNEIYENDFYPMEDGAGVYLACGTGNERIHNNTFTVLPGQEPAFGVHVNAKDTAGVPAGAEYGILGTIRNVKVNNNEFNNTSRAVLLTAMDATERAAWVASHPGFAFPFTSLGEDRNLFGVEIEGNHVFGSTSPANVALLDATDAKDIRVGPNFVGQTYFESQNQEIAIATVRCLDVAVSGGKYDGCEAPMYFTDSSRVAVTDVNFVRGGSALNANIVFDGGGATHSVDGCKFTGGTGYSTVAVAVLNGATVTTSNNRNWGSVTTGL
ncbi:hypothetical protein [Enterovirga sp. CN4-39]|uniref:hypothetical protein n=1 Tax=Enterovirga sp. CN4-39 TaxID=3400910 RepID=UPI003C00B3CA